MAGSDTRPEDAYYETLRILTPRDGNGIGGPGTTDGLGYCGASFCNVGTTIASSYSATGATPINFALPGNPDPITSVEVPAVNDFNTYVVGESPIIFVTNRSNTAELGAPGTCVGTAGGGTFFYCNVVDNTAPLGTAANYPLGNLFGGNTSCDGADPVWGLGGSVPAGGDFPLTVVLREALSGTATTAEFNSFRIYGGTGHGGAGTSVNNSPTFIPPTSQYMNVTPTNAPPGNPLNMGCLGGGASNGTRRGVVGSGEEINTAVKGTANAIGYTFFSFGNVSALSNNASYGYLTLDGVDPIFSSYTSADAGNLQDGKIPHCVAPCPANGIWTTSNYYPNVFNGTYRDWSLLRVICDNTDPNCTDGAKGVLGLVAHAQDDIHCGMAGTCVAGQVAGVPDYLPFSQDGSFGAAGGYGDAGKIRSHYAYRINAALKPNKYADSHSFEKFKLAGLAANLANNGNATLGYAEVGGDVGGCIIPAVPAIQCSGNISGATRPVAGTIKYALTSACSGTPAVNDYIAVSGMQTNGDTGVGDPYNGAFQITAVNNIAGGFIKVAGAGAATAGTPTSTGVQATVSTGCSQ
jgi:hypothetical protein